MNRLFLTLLVVASVMTYGCTTQERLLETTYEDEGEYDDYDDASTTDASSDYTSTEEIVDETRPVTDEFAEASIGEPIEDTVAVEETAPIEEVAPVAEEPALVVEESVTDNRYDYDYNGSEQKKAPERDFSMNTTKFPFYVILGSFSQENNAINFRNTLMADGYSNSCILRESGLFRVAVSGYNEMRQAINEMNKIRMEKSSDCWLLIEQ